MNIIRVPDQVMIEGEEGLVGYCEAKGETWTFNDVAVTTSPGQGRLTVDVEAPKTALRRVRLRWHLDVPIDAHFLGDAWERGYGEFEWRGMVPERVMPWYFLLSDSSGTHGFGVKTGPAAMCFWQADSAGVSLWLDLRNGDTGVMLGERVLRAAEVVCREGRGDESAFVAAREFCKMLCDSPRIPTHAVYGSN
ncbi:MAG: hypothetical protein QF662_02635, partial [Phycisphaerae bacterium]|nr:hypothetical protein [Phycisphaerae bacterium]